MQSECLTDILRELEAGTRCNYGSRTQSGHTLWCIAMSHSQTVFASAEGEHMLCRVSEHSVHAKDIPPALTTQKY